MFYVADYIIFGLVIPTIGFNSNNLSVPKGNINKVYHEKGTFDFRYFKASAILPESVALLA